MKHPVTYRALRIFSWLFIVLAALAIMGGIGAAIFIDSNDFVRGTIEFGAKRLERFIYTIFGVSYALSFLFLGLVTRALSILISEVTHNEHRRLTHE